MATKLVKAPILDSLGRTRGWNDFRLTPVAAHSIAVENRHTTKPHEHSREIERRKTQARIAAGTHPWRGRKFNLAFFD